MLQAWPNGKFNLEDIGCSWSKCNHKPTPQQQKAAKVSWASPNTVSRVFVHASLTWYCVQACTCTQLQRRLDALLPQQSMLHSNSGSGLMCRTGYSHMTMLLVIHGEWCTAVQDTTVLALPYFAQAAPCVCRLLPSTNRPLPTFWAFLITRLCATSSALEEALEARNPAACFTMLQPLWLPTYYAALCDSSWTETRTCITLATGTPFWAPIRSAHTAFPLCVPLGRLCSGLLTLCRADAMVTICLHCYGNDELGTVPASNW